MRGRGEDPGDRIGHIQALERADARKHRIYPDDAEHARADERHSRGEHAVPETAVHAGHGRHRAVERIRHADDHHTGERRLQLRPARGIEPQHLPPEYDRRHRQYAGQDHNKDHRPPGDGARALILLRADVLAHGGGGGLHYGVRRAVEQPLDAHARAVAGDDRRAERVDRSLNNKVGDREERALDTGGDADIHHFLENVAGEMQLLNVQLLRCQQAAHREEAGNALAEHRGNGDARNVNADDDNEKEIHNNVQHTGDGEIDERLARVAERAQRRGGKVIKRHDRQAEEVDPKIHRGERQHLVRAADEPQQRHRERKSESAGDHAADHAGDERCGHGAVQLVGLVRAVIPRAEHAAARGKTHEHIDDQIDHRAVRADRRHGVRPSEPADDDEVGGVERDLQHGREHQRQDKLQKLRQERPFCHIDLISFFHLPTSAQTTYKIRCI